MGINGTEENQGRLLKGWMEEGFQLIQKNGIFFPGAITHKIQQCLFSRIVPLEIKLFWKQEIIPN